jgi:hypothetical protein
MFRLSAAPMVWVAWFVAEEIAQSVKWRSLASEEAEGHLEIEKMFMVVEQPPLILLSSSCFCCY